MVVFMDTSTLYALMDGNDPNHKAAIETWDDLTQSRRIDLSFLTTNYVLVESYALIQNRLGMEAVRSLQEDVIGALRMYWISEEIHGQSMSLLLRINRRQLSLVDCSSFVVMRTLAIAVAFAFDHHFVEQGFSVLPQ